MGAHNCANANGKYYSCITYYDTARTMEWAIDTCASDVSARITPYWNGSPFPNFAVDLLKRLPIGTPSQDQLTCYENSLKIFPLRRQLLHYATSQRPGSSRNLLRQIPIL